MADRMISITLLAVAASIIMHGVSVTPLMAFYGRRQARKARRGESGNRRQEPR
jgi:NhaP-type Na+/H+ or K+/H+ antiporter